MAFLWWYANKVEPVVRPKIDPGVVRSMTARILIGPGLCLLGLAGSFLNVRLGHAVFVLIPLIYVSHTRVDRRWPEVVEDASEKVR